MKIPIFLVFLLIGIEAELILAPDDYEIDPKDAFFRQFRSYDFEHDQELIDPIDVENIPKPGGFQSVENERSKRAYHVLPSPGLTSHFKIYTGENNKYKRTRRDVVRKEDPIEEIATSSENLEEIITTTPKGIPPTNIPTIQPTNQDVIINDFIRFKRNPEKNEEGDQQSRSKREPEIRTEKMVMDRDFNEPGTDREPRGATKEQWIKQPYPVERPVDDNVPSASDNIRAPRVHFVTQRRPGQNNAGALPDQRQTVTQPPNNPPPPPPPPPFHRMHDEREGRARDFDRFAPPPPQPYYPAYPRPRSYEPYRPRYYDPYYERFDDRRYPFEGGYDSRYKYDDRERDGRPMMPPMPPPPPPPPSGNKQRRIIYYATLPEVVRNPNQNNDRYRYRYDGYDDRLPALAPGSMPVGPPPQQPAGGAQTDRYGRKPYSNQLQKQRDYDRATADRKKTPLYPVKVATDVNVREPKKNPERRIYSDVERRYNNYKPPSFQTAEDGNF